MTQEKDFLKYQAPTSPYPRLLEVERAEGSYIYTTDSKKYLDFVAGVSACTLGHCHPAIVKAIQEQCATYMHVNVYYYFNKWSKDGSFQRIWLNLSSKKKIRNHK